jgi:hypothetical protein
MRLPIARKETDMSLVNFIDTSSSYADLSDSADELTSEWVRGMERRRERTRETESRRGRFRRTLDGRIDVVVEA